MPNGITISSDDLDKFLALHAPHLLAPPGGPAGPKPASTPPDVGGAAAPDTLPVGMAPATIARPTRRESNAAGKSEFQAGKPTVTDAPGTSGYFGQRIAAEDYDKAHPWGSPVSAQPGFLGKVGHVFAKAGNIAGDILAPGTMANIPGTDLNKQITRAGDENRFQRATQEETQQQKADTEQEGVEQRPEIAAATGEAKGRLEAQKEADADKRAQANLDSQDSRATQRDSEAEKRQTQTFAHQDEMLQKRLDEMNKKAGEAGTWQLAEDKDGKPIFYNSKTGQQKDAGGIQRSGAQEKKTAAEEKEFGPARAAQQYADDYLANGRFTGSGDEALQEKFFELAKPTTGFRMTQPQIDMLQNSRSWMNSAEAHLRHMATGTWFSDEQRKQIAQTMKDLGAAKVKASGTGQPQGQGGAPAPAGGGRVLVEGKDF
jgi:hypothetical protein